MAAGRGNRKIRSPHCRFQRHLLALFWQRLSLRHFAVCIVILLSWNLAFAQKISAVDPSREWEGAEYADVILTKFSERFPEIPLLLDVKDLGSQAIRNPEQRSFRQKVMNLKAGFRKLAQQRSGAELVDTVKSLVHGNLSHLITALENGHAIYLQRALWPEGRAGLLEQKLDSWLMAQPESSVSPDELMIESLRINEGRVIAAWVTAWNLLRQDWEAVPTRNYSPRMQKFISMTGERFLWHGGVHYIVIPESERTAQRVLVEGHYAVTTELATPKLKMIVSKRGDEFSTIYHRIGVELLTMVTAKITRSRQLGWAMGTAGALGEFIKWTKTAGLRQERAKRLTNDLNGARSGARIFDLVESGRRPSLSAADLGPDHYLISNPQKFGSEYQVPEGRPVQYFGVDVDPKFWLPVMTVEELKLRFEHALEFDSEVMNVVVLVATEDYERLMNGLKAYENAGFPDASLNSLIEKYQRNNETRSPEHPEIIADVDTSITLNQRMLSQNEKAFDFDGARKDLNSRIYSMYDKILRVQRTPPLEKASVFNAAKTRSCQEIFLVGAP